MRHLGVPQARVRAGQPVSHEPHPDVAHPVSLQHGGHPDIGEAARRLRDHDRAVNQRNHNGSGQRHGRRTAAHGHDQRAGRVQSRGAHSGSSLVAAERIVVQRVDELGPGPVLCGVAFEAAGAVCAFDGR